MLEFLNQYLVSSPFIPHGHCYLWKPGLVWLHLLSDSLIAMAYYSIPVMLIYFVRQRRDVPFTGIFWMFGAFIAACGTSHILEVWTLWHPIYWVSGTVKAFTAFISLYTASELFELIPQALTLPSPEQLQQANDRLSAEIQEKEKAQREILILNTELEIRVAERTTQLQISNELKEQALISERQAREEAESSRLQVQNVASRLTLAMEAAKMGSWDWQTETGEIFWTPFHEIIFGYEPGRGEYSYDEWRQRIHPDDFPKIEADLKKAEAEKNTYEGEYRVVHPDKTVRWVFSLGRFLYREDGTTERMVGMSIDITDRKQNEERFRISQELSLDAFMIMSSLRDEGGEIIDFQWTYVNPKAAEIIKQPPDKLLGEGLLKMFPNIKTHSDIFARYVRVVETGQAHDLEVFYDEDGISGWFRNMAVKLDDGVAVFFSDITERKYTELAIKESEKRYAALAQLSPVGIFRCDREGNCFYLNERWSQLSGLSVEEGKGSGWIRSLHPDDRFLVGQRWQKLLEENQPFELEYRFQRPDGTIVWVLGQALPEIETQGEIISYIGTVTDISLAKHNEAQRLEAESALRESQRFIGRIAETTPGLLYIYDLKLNRNIYVNGQVRSILGYDQEYIQGMSVTELLSHFDAEDAARRPEFLRRLELSQDNEVHSFEFRFLCGDGQWRWLCSYETVFSRDESGKPQQILGIALDVSDAKEAQLELEEQERELRQLTELLKKRNEDLDGFAYIVSHDLKAPLRAIAHLSEWIEEDLDGVLSEDNREQMGLLRKRVYRMESLINGLLDYSRVGRTQLAAENVNVENLLAEIIDSLSPPGSFDVRVIKPLPTITAKRLLLSQVFANLIGNAIKHHDRADGKITISGQESGDFYRFSVTDDGPGIPPQYHGKIFAIFQTLKGQESNESTGIGLSIVKKIIETEGGAIQLESAEGQGTSFRFTWPKNPRQEED
ncbi:MAG: Adaptive-response sensory-kinase SasA [Chroococcopsis gigantea SAG 12.99]|jgi:PAS domain S-box-containing protein|nr:PAS domain-containing protein [Chlorogloea purpurea SAG 13.99]MDV2998899.1 Adaptive-response sensory-kinase SasA [Chroococcopsis gigantea SAG 12.99]